MPELPTTPSPTPHQTIPFWLVALVALLVGVIAILATLLLQNQAKKPGLGQGSLLLASKYNFPLDLEDPAVSGRAIFFHLTGTIDKITPQETNQSSIWLIKTDSTHRYSLVVPWNTDAVVYKTTEPKEVPEKQPDYIKNAKVGDKVKLIGTHDLVKKVTRFGQVQKLTQ